MHPASWIQHPVLDSIAVSLSTNSIRRQDRNIYSDTEVRALSSKEELGKISSSVRPLSCWRRPIGRILDFQLGKGWFIFPSEYLRLYFLFKPELVVQSTTKSVLVTPDVPFGLATYLQQKSYMRLFLVWMEYIFVWESHFSKIPWQWCSSSSMIGNYSCGH